MGAHFAVAFFINDQIYDRFDFGAGSVFFFFFVQSHVCCFVLLLLLRSALWIWHLIMKKNETPKVFQLAKEPDRNEWVQNSQQFSCSAVAFYGCRAKSTKGNRYSQCHRSRFIFSLSLCLLCVQTTGKNSFQIY